MLVMMVEETIVCCKLMTVIGWKGNFFVVVVASIEVRPIILWAIVVSGEPVALISLTYIVGDHWEL